MQTSSSGEVSASSQYENSSTKPKSIVFDTNNHISMEFKLKDYIVYSQAVKQSDGSYAMSSYKKNLKNDTVKHIGDIPYVCTPSSDYVYIDDTKIYTCIAYDIYHKLLDSTGDPLMHIIQIYLVNNSITTVHEFPSIAYI